VFRLWPADSGRNLDLMLVAPKLSELEPAPPEIAGAMPAARHHFAPASAAEAAAVFSAASDERAPVLIWGAGSHQAIGYPVYPEVVVSTGRLDRVIAWEPEDLTLVAEAGVSVGEIERTLGERNQTAGLPEHAAEATLGGVVAAGLSGFTRSRLGPLRERMLEVVLATGDGRVVRAGGRVVKNVSGYDIPRLATGSFGSLGLIVSVCLKLWPRPEGAMTVRVDDPAAAWRRLYRPLAVLESSSAGGQVFLQGTSAEVEAQARVAGGEAIEGLRWPEPIRASFTGSLRVPPVDTATAVSKLPSGSRFIAQHGVGVVDFGMDVVDIDSLRSLRAWAEAKGGSLVSTGPERPVAFDPWGTPPVTIDLQHRVVAAFDPVRVSNPGRLPGGL
jgi:glycolate oxidase FAD binding subunit